MRLTSGVESRSKARLRRPPARQMLGHFGRRLRSRCSRPKCCRWRNPAHEARVAANKRAMVLACGHSHRDRFQRPLAERIAARGESEARKLLCRSSTERAAFASRSVVRPASSRFASLRPAREYRTPSGEHSSASRSCSIIGPSSCRPANTHSEKNPSQHFLQALQTCWRSTQLLRRNDPSLFQRELGKLSRPQPAESEPSRLQAPAPGAPLKAKWATARGPAGLHRPPAR